MAQRTALPDVLHHIVDLNIEFRELIATGQWAEATQLEAQRRSALQELFEQPMEAAVRQHVVSTLTELLQSDKALVRDLETARDLCSEQIGKLQLGRTAAAAYSDSGLMVKGPRMMQ